MNPAITNLAVTLIVMQVAKKVPFEDPNVLNAIRGLYVLSNIIILSIYLYTKSIINKKNGKYIKSFIWGSDSLIYNLVILIQHVNLSRSHYNEVR